jgi:putative hemolysin
MNLIALILIACMLLLNAVLAAYELALASVREESLVRLVEQRKHGAKAALAMKERMEGSLAVVQLGITFVGAVAGAVGGLGAEESISPWLQAKTGFAEPVSDFIAVAVVVVPLAAFTIIFAELVPKSFAIKNAEWVVVRLSPVMKLFSVAAHPVILSMEWVTKKVVGLLERGVPDDDVSVSGGGINELLMQARALRMSRIISPQQERVIHGADRLSKLKVRDIHVPAEDIKMLFAEGRLTEHLITVHLDVHTRFPVTTIRNDPQAIIGYVNVKDLFFLAKTHPHNPVLYEITRPLVSVPDDITIGEAFGRMMSDHAHLALVRGPNNHVVGMITLEDILEELVGDIQDEFDRLPRTLTRAGRQWVSGGGVSLERIRTALEMPEWAAKRDGRVTLSEFLASLRGEDLKAGDALDCEGVHVLIRKVRRSNPMEVVLSPAVPVAAGAPEAH